MIQSPFFWLTLAGSALIFWILPQRFRFGFMAAVSYGYLLTLEPLGVTIVIAWILVFFYLSPHALAGRKYSLLVMLGLILGILSYLFYIKYLPVLLEKYQEQRAGYSIIAPLGISYLTFKLIHYAIEVARGNIQDRSLSKFFCYILLFPIFTAGPIERFDHFNANIETTWRLESAVEGTTRICYGLIKGMVLAQIVQPEAIGLGIPESPAKLIEALPELSFYHAWGFVVLAYLYAYLDFSAYSDIAIGASRLFGFRIMENFRFPIIARNISDFWKRWHMTLANWCQTYVYLPVIGYSRNPYAAAYCTFIAMGLWHGMTPSWLMWGLYHASGVSFYMTWNRLKRSWKIPVARTGVMSYLGIPITFLFVSGSYAFSSTGNSGMYSIRVFLKLFGIDLE